MATDVTDEASVRGAVGAAMETGGLHAAVSCAGIAPARVLGRDGPHDLAGFARVVQVNLVGTFNVTRLAAEVMAGNDPGPDGERGVIVNTASVAAFDGQIGQAAYSASKAGVAGMTLPIARELARHGIRVMAVAPGIFDTPMLAAMPDQVRDSLGAQVRSPPASAAPRSTPPWSATSSRTPCSTARSSASTAPSAWPPGNCRIRSGRDAGRNGAGAVGRHHACEQHHKRRTP